MRRPNPARPNFQYLEPPDIVEVVRYAVIIVHELGAKNDYGAYEVFIETDNWPIEKRAALWSCLNSQQKSTIGSLIEAERVNTGT